MVEWLGNVTFAELRVVVVVADLSVAEDIGAVGGSDVWMEFAGVVSERV